MTALMWASKLHRNGVATALLEHGADVSAVDAYGWTALMYASQRGYMRISNDLVAKGADINHASKEGLTALHVACQHDSMRMMSTLIKLGADTNLLDGAGLTAFDHLSTSEGTRSSRVYPDNSYNTLVTFSSIKTSALQSMNMSIYSEDDG